MSSEETLSIVFRVEYTDFSNKQLRKKCVEYFKCLRFSIRTIKKKNSWSVEYFKCLGFSKQTNFEGN